MKVDFRIKFVCGVLKGIEIEQSLPFPDMESVNLWLAGMTANIAAKKLSYELLSYTIN